MAERPSIFLKVKSQYTAEKKSTSIRMSQYMTLGTKTTRWIRYGPLEKQWRGVENARQKKNSCKGDRLKKNIVQRRSELKNTCRVNCTFGHTNRAFLNGNWAVAFYCSFNFFGFLYNKENGHCSLSRLIHFARRNLIIDISSQTPLHKNPYA